MTTTSVVSSNPRASVLEIQDSVCSEQHTLVLRGELDLANTPELEAVIQRLCAGGVGSLLLDLDLAFMDSSGLRVILAARDLCEESGCALTVRLSSPAVRRLFEVSGVLDRLPVEPQQPSRLYGGSPRAIPTLRGSLERRSASLGTR
jgi:anti-anti-sigma factor